MEERRELPNWEQVYQEKAVEEMPWFSATLDPDVEQALQHLGLQSGAVLDLGTGPGTQAIALAERGFQVTATDVSPSAIAKAQQRAKSTGCAIAFQTDNILHSHLDQIFDVVLDRGVFHVFAPEERPRYLQTVAHLVKPQGYLLLKCFSHHETREGGPYRFTPEAIRQLFEPFFTVCSISETVYYGSLDPHPKALFGVLQRLE